MSNLKRATSKARIALEQTLEPTPFAKLQILVSSKLLTIHTCSEHIASSIPFRACFFIPSYFTTSFSLVLSWLSNTCTQLELLAETPLKPEILELPPKKHPMNRELLKNTSPSKHFFYTRHLFAAFSKKENLQSFALEKADE